MRASSLTGLCGFYFYEQAVLKSVFQHRSSGASQGNWFVFGGYANDVNVGLLAGGGMSYPSDYCLIVESDKDVIINEGGNDADFRVESDTDTHMLFVDASANAVGIGTSSPSAQLHVDGGGLLCTGATGGTPVSGAGTRLMWIPSKAAFRAGGVPDDQWDNANIGDYSVALGYNNTASGDQSTALGADNRATGFRSTALGTFTLASGKESTAMGYNTGAEADHATAMGYHNVAFGENSTVMGREVEVHGSGSVGIGLDGTAYSISSNNVMAILGGNVGIGTTSPGAGFSSVFDVVGTSTFRLNPSDTSKGLQLDDSGTQFRIGCDATSGTPYDLHFYTHPNWYQLFLDQSTGRVGIGTNSPSVDLHVDGDVYTSGGVDIDGTLRFDSATADGSLSMANNEIHSVSQIDVSSLYDNDDNTVQIVDDLVVSGQTTADLLKLNQQTSAPASPTAGMIVFADGTSWNPGSGQGIYAYYNSGWHSLG